MGFTLVAGLGWPVGRGCAVDGEVVAGGVFDFVHHGVGGAQDGVHGVGVGWEGGEAEGAGDVEGKLLAGEERRGCGATRRPGG